MVATVDQAKCTEISTKLADMRVLQLLLVSGAELLRVQCSDPIVRDRLQQVKRHEETVLASLDQAIKRSGVQCPPCLEDFTLAEKFQQTLQTNELSLTNKVLQYTLLKYQQIFTGLMLHTAAEAVGGATAAAMKPLNDLSFELEIHQEELKEILEILATREMTGREPSHSFLHHLQDAWTGW